eukprot:gb/GEZN01007069.1/.p1 GENE.gb/GEZN01007069.1/~~gb/GEZN01007069.1/.p1  ORF type:complete len:461 (+),score=40.29 gb/GEZN01007069.1/:34-1416(+)
METRSQRKKQKIQHVETANNPPHALPDDLLCQIFSFLTVAEHFTIISRLSSGMARTMWVPDAWPDRLDIEDHHSSERTLLAGFRYKEGKQRGVIPDHIVARLGRLGFQSIGSCQHSLSLLANPITKRVSTYDLGISSADLAPLAGMYSLEELELILVPPSREIGLEHLQKLPIRKLTIKLDEHYGHEVSFSENFKKTLESLPLTDLSLMTFEQEGFSVHLPSKSHRLEYLKLCIVDLDETFFRRISCYSQLKTLDMQMCTFSDTFLQLLEGLPLQSLSLSSCWNYDDESLRHLRGLRSLRKLDLSDSDQITGEGLGYLSSAKLPIEDLDLSNCARISNEFLPHLRGLPLKKLKLGGTGLTDEGVAIVCAVCPQLEVLQLSSYAESTETISDAMFSHLLNLRLTELRLFHRGITRGKLVSFLKASSGSLKRLLVSERHFSAKDRKYLRRASPFLTVTSVPN